VVAAGLTVLVPAWATAGQVETVPPTPPEDSRYPTTSTNVLVTSPPPTVAASTTIVAPAAGRMWPVDVPDGCNEPPLPDVVFVGTVQVTDFQTARFRIDQVRAGAVEAFSAGGLIDVRYGIDTKFLGDGAQYLVGASVDPAIGVLVSRVAAAAPLFGGDQVIGRSESEADCPPLPDPVRTLLTNGRPVDSGLLRPLEEARGDVARSVLVPLLAAAAIILGLASLRWLITGLGWSISELFRAAHDPAERKVARRSPPSDGRR